MRLIATSLAADGARPGWVLLGLLSFASSGVCARLAQAHLALCGAGQAAHCGWCYATGAFAVMGLGWLVMAAARAAAPARA